MINKLIQFLYMINRLLQLKRNMIKLFLNNKVIMQLKLDNLNYQKKIINNNKI